MQVTARRAAMKVKALFFVRQTIPCGTIYSAKNSRIFPPLL
jgi:hypothetical protein